MKLVDLVSYFRRGGTFESFCREHALDIDSEVFEVYARKPVDLDSELGFFSIDEAEGRIEIQSEGMQYQNLFDFFYFLGVIEDARGVTSDEELARLLFSYAQKDA